MNGSTQKAYKTRRLSFLIKVNDSIYLDTYMNIPRFESSANMWIRAVVLFKVLIVTVKALSNDFEVTKNQIQQLERDLAVQKSMNAQLRAGLYHSRLNRGLLFLNMFWGIWFKTLNRVSFSSKLFFKRKMIVM